MAAPYKRLREAREYSIRMPELQFSRTNF